jgi:hypothetical protein
MENKKIDFSLYRRSAESSDIERAQNPQPQLRPQSEVERHPTFFQRQKEQSAQSNWSGGIWGGRVDRSR